MTDARIEIQPDGPYMVSGDILLVRRSIGTSEQGDSVTWETTAELEASGEFGLCRCGGSSNKPFCDGTHSINGFDGTETAPTDTYDERATVYEGTGVVVRDDRSICEHAGFCGNRVSNVWKMVEVPDDSTVTSQMMSMIEHCPSGALTYRMTPESADAEPTLPVEIGVTDDGPYFVTGGVTVVRADGQAFESRNRMTLCRCGASKNKPLCDGSHADVGFTDS